MPPLKGAAPAPTVSQPQSSASPLAQSAPRSLILACGALAQEILTLIQLNSWHHMDLICLPATLHNTPDKIPDLVEQAVHTHRDRFDTIFVAYADCGTGGLLQKRCAALGVEMIAGPHCYSFFTGNALFATQDEISTFYLTDFLARQFETLVWRPLGLHTHPELHQMYFGHYTDLVYLAQTDDPALDHKAQACAARLKLTYSRRFTGYGDLDLALRPRH